MKKLVARLRLFLMRWLGVTDALIVAHNEREKLVQINIGLMKQLQRQNNRTNKMEAEYQKFYNQMRLIMEVTNVGVDVSVNKHDRSWAAICIQGSNNVAYMKFVDLGNESIRDIQEFLRRYEFDKRNVNFDAPFGMRKDTFFNW
jgi:hypothetical protein